METFKNWLITQESSPSTRRVLGQYPPQASDFFVRPPYGKEKTCKKIKGYKLINMDISDICDKK